MGSEAHVHILALLEKAELGLVGQVVHMLELVFLAPLGHQLFRVLAVQDEGLERKILLGDLLHFLLNGVEVLLRQLPVSEIDVIVKAVLRRRAEGKVRLREQALDRLGHDMGRAVPQDMQFFFRRAFRNRTVLINDLHAFLFLPIIKCTPVSKGASKIHGSTLLFHSFTHITRARGKAFPPSGSGAVGASSCREGFQPRSSLSEAESNASFSVTAFNNVSVS